MPDIMGPGGGDGKAKSPHEQSFWTIEKLMRIRYFVLVFG
jgi:hypothetical protein